MRIGMKKRLRLEEYREEDKKNSIPAPMRRSCFIHEASPGKSQKQHMTLKNASLTEWSFGDFPLAVMRYSQPPMKFHFHEFMELVIIGGGQGIHFTRTESYPIAAGDVFVIRRRDAHGYSNTNRLSLTNVLFYPDHLALPLRELDSLRGYHALFDPSPSRTFYGLKNRLRLDLKQLTLAENLIHSLEAELKKREHGFSFMSKALFMQLVCFLSRCYEGRQTLVQKPLERISRAIEFMEANYTQPINLAELAALTNMSQSKLYRDFKAATGLSTKEYLIRLRVMKGAELLRRGEANVTETAFQAGFNDSNYFCRVFHAVMGVTPGVFRKMRNR